MKREKGTGKVNRVFDLTLTGQVCLDLVNTNDWRTSDSPRELLNSYADLLRWGRHTGLLKEREARGLALAAAQHPKNASDALNRSIALRETLFRIFSAAAAGKRADAADMDALNRPLSGALARLRLGTDGAGYVWEWKGGEANLESVLWPVLRSAGELLTSGQLRLLLRQCPGEGCAWLFLDTSRNKSRRWCAMEVCGNRSKARRHYEQVRAGR